VFLRNAWYVAAWDREVTRGLLPVQILGDHVVLYRTEVGVPVALEDACPHRKLPLSMGRLVGDEVECGYHGLVFDPAGRCTRIPGASKIPRAACVRSYPAVSRYGFVWIWMGAVAEADPNRIFPVAHYDDPRWGRNEGGTMTVDCNYLFVTDNLLDPTHVSWVHRTSFGNAACEEEPIEVTVSSDGVTAARWMYNAEVAPFYKSLVSFEGRCDRLQHYEVRFPSHAIIKAVFAPAGTGGKDRPLDETAFVMDSYNFMTPVTANQTRYFWFQMRNCYPGDKSISKAMDDGMRAAFEEDRLILVAVHQGFANKATPNIDLAIDRAPLHFRRRLGQLIAAERGESVGDIERSACVPQAEH
jgi:phenylpropionate dioxygenase-like ring-hydroxylating dioxygenase large terminal subunit